jgi:hypothetical protein
MCVTRATGPSTMINSPSERPDNGSMTIQFRLFSVTTS